MPKITFIEHDGTEHVVEAALGKSVMEAATANMVPGVVAECGGCCACATCHVYIDEPWFSRLVPPDPMESGMLEGAMHPGPHSRLSCQITVTEDLEGLVARIPESQF